MTVVTVSPSPLFGFVLLELVASIILHHVYMAGLVMAARKKYNVNYPALYADKTINKDAELFNCVQRGHQNSLENQPMFLVLLIVAGVKYPLIASVAGAIYLVGRFFYFKGYSTGTPDGRQQGLFLHFGEIILMGCVLTWAVQLIINAS